MQGLKPGMDLKMKLVRFQGYCEENQLPYLLPPLFQYLQSNNLPGQQVNNPNPSHQVAIIHRPGNVDGAVAYQPGGQPAPNVVQTGKYAGAMVYQPGAPVSIYQPSPSAPQKN